MAKKPTYEELEKKSLWEKLFSGSKGRNREAKTPLSMLS